ncbi:hypothetical protein CK203_055012 [Vitis vinifera]|uniref:Uncharacterized protein n=1 Tax=Vitis vinifera TaxID=29760 RepID=A0A438GNC7_VITVI|nr:hypothetical protein CK203_055012 [Vitis vinifera]
MSILLPNHSATLWILCENFRSCEGEFGTRVPLRSTGASFRSCETLEAHSTFNFAAAKRIAKWLRKWHFAAKLAFFAKLKLTLSLPLFYIYRSFELRKGFQNQSAPFSQVFIFFLEPHRASLRSSSPISSPAKFRQSNSSSGEARRQSLRRGVTLPEPSPVPTPVPSPIPANSASGAISGAASRTKEPQPPLPEPQIPSEIALEEVIRRPMLTQPPIEGNLDCRARPFHSELCFDIAHSDAAGACTVIQPAEEIPYGAPTDSERLFLPQDSHGFLSIHDNQKLKPCKFPMSQANFDDFRAWTSHTELEMVHTLPEELLDHISLLYFEEKVHKKKLQRADTIPFLFPRLLCQILEHLGYPSEPQWSESAFARVVRALETLTASQSSLAQEMAAIRACQEQMLATQAQHTAILRQLQLHFDLPPAVEPSTLPQQSHTLILRASSPS